MNPPMRERILGATLEVIRARGIAAATTKEIARVAAVSEGSLYNHFANKTDLIGAAMGEVAGGIRDALRALAGRAGEGTVEGNLAEFAVAAIRFYGELLPITGPVLGDREVLDWVRRKRPGGAVLGPVQGHAALIGYLEAERRTGRLAGSARTADLAALLLGACHQYAFLQLLADPADVAERAGLPGDAAEVARRLVRSLLAGCLPPRGVVAPRSGRMPRPARIPPR